MFILIGERCRSHEIFFTECFMLHALAAINDFGGHIFIILWNNVSEMSLSDIMHKLNLKILPVIKIP